jgi:hypothetical protein
MPMKTILLDAAIAMQKVIDADGTVEQVLELVDHIQDFKLDNFVRETR